MRRPCRLVASLWIGSLAVILLTAPAGAQEPVFGRTAEVMKLLETRCVQCHGAKRRGGLDMTARAKLLASGEDGPVVVPGDVGKSRLLRLVRHAEKPHMPQTGPKLA